MQNYTQGEIFPWETCKSMLGQKYAIKSADLCVKMKKKNKFKNDNYEL
jgi:hypothetical protein